MMSNLKKVGIYLCVLFVCVCLVDSELHRAKNPPRNSGFSRAASPDQLRGRNHVKQQTSDYRMLRGYQLETWLLSMGSAVLVGLSGIFPLLVIPLEAGKKLKEGANHALLNVVLSFAVGSLLGDVFLHLLPEAWAHLERVGDPHAGHMKVGLWVLTGILTFLIIEKTFTQEHEKKEETQKNYDTQSESNKNSEKEIKSTNKQGKLKGAEVKNGFNKDLHRRALNLNKSKEDHVANGNSNTRHKESQSQQNAEEEDEQEIHISGYLNLFANVIDNFTHGLALAGSYIAGNKVGMLTTFAILVHEIPHEVGDFAILLRSGFDRWKAAKAQLLTASGGLLGAVVALCAESAQIAGDSVAWILPFTSGGFLYIALVTVVPDLLQETNPRESFKQLVSLMCGIGMMILVTYLC